MQLSAQESSAAFWSGAKQGALRSFGYVAAAAVVVGIGMAFFPGTISIGAALLTGISTVFTVGMFSGHQSLAQYHQSKHNQMYESKIARLEGQDTSITNGIDEVQHSPRITTIIEEGARSASSSFADAEQERTATPKNHTIH